MRHCCSVKETRTIPTPFLRLNRFNDTVKGLFFLQRDFRKHFSVECDVFLLEHTHKCAVREVVRFKCRADADIPESAKITFFLSAVRERVVAGMQPCFPGLPLFRGATPTIPLHLSEQGFSAFKGNCTSFYTNHKLFMKKKGYTAASFL